MAVPLVAWSDAPGLLAAIGSEKRASLGRPVIVGISGPVGSGKSALASRLSACVLATDDYLPDYDKVARHERDEPAAADFPLLSRQLGALRAGETIMAPVWSFKTHRREGTRRLARAELIVCEGIHALHDTVFPLIDLAVFVEAPAAVRWSRWEHLERAGVRGLGVEGARAFFHEVAEPTFEKYADVYRARAHVIVRNDSGVPTSPA